MDGDKISKITYTVAGVLSISSASLGFYEVIINWESFIASGYEVIGLAVDGSAMITGAMCLATGLNPFNRK